jgi:WD40 repeat protein
MAMHTRRLAPTILTLLVVLVPAGVGWATSSARTTRVSVSSAGVQANGDSGLPTISADGRFVAFVSVAPDLVPRDTNAADDVFVRDRKTNRTRRVSLSSGGVQATGRSYGSTISADGRFVSFYSEATNLVAGDTNNRGDIFVRDRKTNRTQRVSVSSTGAQADGPVYESTISATGRFVAFVSEATNLVVNDTNGRRDVFVRDLNTNRTQRASLTSAGGQVDGFSESPAISADGRFVSFVSQGTNLVAGDTNPYGDAFVRDRKTHRTRRVSVSYTGGRADSGTDASTISADGRFVGFVADATNLVPGDTNDARDVFILDQKTNRTRRISVSSSGAQGDGASVAPTISADGRFVAFFSLATNLVAGDTNNVPDVFVRDRKTNRTRRVSVSSTGAQANAGVGSVSGISADGRFVTFFSPASDLVPGDTNQRGDVFVRGPLR